MKISNLILFNLLVCVFSLNIKAQDGLLLKELQEKWKNSYEYTMEIADLMPDSLYSYKPIDSEMTFGEQLLHMGQNMIWLSAVYLMNDTTYIKNEVSAKSLTVKEIKKQLDEAYQFALKAHKEMDVNRLNDEMPFFAGPKTARQIIHLIHDHATHHRGQLIVYLRLNEIKPPKYRGW